MVDPKSPLGPLSPGDPFDPHDPDSLDDVDKSFQDDRIGAQLAAREQAKRLHRNEQARQHIPKDILTISQKVNRAAHFQPAREEHPYLKYLKQQAKRAGKGDKSGPTGSHQGTDVAIANQPFVAPHNFSRLQERLIAAYLELLEQETWADAFGESASDHEEEGESEERSLSEEEALLVEQRQHVLLRQIQHHLQHILVGGVDFVPHPNPQVTFQIIFDGLLRWPVVIPPGQKPENQSQWDEFVAWVFAPPLLAEE